MHVLRVQGAHAAQQLQRDEVHLVLRVHDACHLARLPAQLLHDDAGLLPGIRRVSGVDGVSGVDCVSGFGGIGGVSGVGGDQ